MADADASAAFELEDDSLSAGLDHIAARFAEIASQINAQFAGANQQLARTATSANNIGASTPRIQTMARGLTLAANAGSLVAVSVGGIVRVVNALAHLVQYIPDSVGKWVAPVKAAASEHSRMLASFAAMSRVSDVVRGKLTLLHAGMLGLTLAEAGASKQMAALGATGALATSKIVAGARAAVRSVLSLPGVAARAAGGLLSSLGRSASTIATIAAPVAGLALALGPIGAATVGVAAGFRGVKKSVEEAAQMQGLQTSFITLLGSAQAAQNRMAELSKFAMTTPFELPGVTKASRVLETLTRGALSTGPGLRLVGDAAAVSQQPIEDLAVHVGRLYDGLMNGRAVGESLQRLQELGLISAQTRGKLEDLQKSGAKGGDVWKVAALDLMRFSGEMERQSGTWSGLMSNLTDSIGAIFRAFGAPVITALTPFLQRLIDFVGSLETMAKRAGLIFAGWSALIAEIFADGKMGEALTRITKIAFMEAVNFLLSGLVGVGNVLMTLIGGVAREFVTILAAATTGDFWKGLGNALKSAGAALIAMLLEGVAKVLDMLRDVPKIGGAAGRAADRAHSMAGKMAGTSMDAGAQAGVNLAPLFDGLTRNMATTFERALKAFNEGRESTGDVFDTKGAKQEFMQWLQPIAQAAQKAVNAAAAAAQKGGLPPPVGDNSTTTGKKGNDVASLQKIGGGGGFSITRADPLLTEARNQTTEIKGLRGDVKELKQAMTPQKRPGDASAPVFG